MQNSSSAQFHDHEYVKGAKGGRDHDEEVTRYDHLGMVMDEGQPPLRVDRACAPVRRAGTSPPCGAILESRVSVSTRWRCVPRPRSDSQRPSLGSTRRRSLARRGRPVGFDFQRQNSRNPLRCHRMSVSGFTFTSASRHWNIRLRVAIIHRVESSARRGLTFRSWNSASCLRRKRFSAARALRECATRKASRTRSTHDQRQCPKAVCNGAERPMSAA